MSKKLKFIYMAGGASYTIEPLKTIIKSKHKLIHVFTKPPKPSGRGKKILKNPLQNFLDKNQISYSNPKNLKVEEEQKKIKLMQPDLILVFSYGYILPQTVLSIPKYGCLNIHASLLPKWRGASPVQYSLLNNEKKTGFSLIIMNKNVDEGKLLYKKSIAIEDNDNTLSLLEKITNLACNSIIKVMEEFVSGNIVGKEQNHKDATYTNIINKKETYLDFRQNADIIMGKVRAYNPNPGAKCFINGELVKILEARKEILKNNKNLPGTIIDEKLLIACQEDGIRPLVLQREGKKPLKLLDALNGWKILPGSSVKSRV